MKNRAPLSPLQAAYLDLVGERAAELRLRAANLRAQALELEQLADEELAAARALVLAELGEAAPPAGVDLRVIGANGSRALAWSTRMEEEL